VKIRYINTRVELIKIRKREIIEHIYGVKSIIVVILYEHHKILEISKSYKVLSIRKPTKEKNKEKKKIPKNSNSLVNIRVSIMIKKEEKIKKLNH